MAWLENKTVEALWANDQQSNSWAWIDGGWKKFQDDHDDACTNFTILAAHAKETNSLCKVRVEDNRIREMYVW